MMRFLASLVLVLPLTVGTRGPCTEPNYPAIEDCPFPVDPNLVVGKLLAWVRLEAGEELIHTRTWCDPNGDPATVEIVDGPEGLRLVDRPKTQSYTLLWRPKGPGITAIVVRVTDKPSRRRPLSDTGTILVQVLPAGRRRTASPCGGQPR